MPVDENMKEFGRSIGDVSERCTPARVLCLSAIRSLVRSAGSVDGQAAYSFPRDRDMGRPYARV